MSESTYQLSMSRDEFSKLVILLKVFENSCTDCDIKGGVFRCRNNDRQAVINMDLTSILDDKDLTFSIVKNKVALLKTFELDDNVQVEDKTVIIESNESNYEFRDPFSQLTFRKPISRLMDNQFITEDEFNGIIQLSDDNLLFSNTLSNYMKRRIGNISLGFTVDTVICNISESKASMSVRAANKEDTTIISKDIPVNRDVGTKTFNMTAMPFILDVASDLKIDCYSTSTNDVYMCKFSQTLFNIPINIYTRVKAVSA